MIELDKLNAALAEAIGESQPTSLETANALSNFRVDVRGWVIHRRSGAPIAEISSYYWTPPPFAQSPIESKNLRNKMASLGWDYDLGRYGYMPALVTFALRRDGTRHVGTADNEELAVALGSAKACGIEVY